MKKKSSAWGSLTSILGFIIGLVLVRAVPAVGTVLLIAFVFGIIATLYGRWYLKKGNRSAKWLNFLFWSNVATWLIPPVGFFTSTATYTINSENNGSDRTKYMILAAVGFGLSFINSLIGALHFIH